MPLRRIQTLDPKSLYKYSSPRGKMRDHSLHPREHNAHYDLTYTYTCSQTSPIINRASHLTWSRLLNYLKTTLCGAYRRLCKAITTNNYYKPTKAYEYPCPCRGNIHTCTFSLVQWCPSQVPDKTNMGYTLFIIITLPVVTLHSYTQLPLIMVNMRASSPKSEGINSRVDDDSLAEMQAAMDKLHHHNLTLQNDVHNIRQRE